MSRRKLSAYLIELFETCQATSAVGNSRQLLLETFICYQLFNNVVHPSIINLKYFVKSHDNFIYENFASETFR